MGRRTTSLDSNRASRVGRGVEWAAAVFSGVIVMAMIGFLIFQAVTASEAHPDPVAIVDQVTPANTGFQLAFRARNAGKATAAEVTYRATLRQDGLIVDSADVTFDYLPARAERQGAFIFTQDPRRFDISVRAVSYVLP